MLKVLIIDDEPIVREGLKTIIEWENYGFHVCGEAVNGKDGWIKINEYRPDLIIVDMKMPVMDGIELIEKIRREGRDVKIIILSGYSSFEYARKAVALGAEGYLLKPVDEDELTELIARVRDKIIEERKIKELLNETIGLTKERLIEKLITNEVNWDTLNQMNEKVQLGFPWEMYQVLLLEMNQQGEPKLRDLIESYVHARKLGFVFSINGKTGILCRNLDFQKDPAPLMDFYNEIKRMAGIELLIAVGTAVTQLKDIPVSYEEANQLLQRKFLYGPHGVITRGNVGKEAIKDKDEELDLEQIQEALYIAVKHHQKEKIEFLLDDVKMHHQLHFTTPEAVKAYYGSLYGNIIRKLMEDKQRFLDNPMKEEAVLAQIYGMGTLHQLDQFMKEQFLQLSDLIDSNDPAAVIDQAIEYIQRNYYKDLKLENLARIFNYNSAYLGKLFKKHTGMSFNRYLDTVRMEKAKFLLEQGLKVYEVSQRVGYANIDYFYKKFKSYTGRPPSDYKKGDL